MVFQSAHYKRQEDDDLETTTASETAAARPTSAATTIRFPSETEPSPPVSFFIHSALKGF